MRNRLICTVRTSLFNNLRNAQEETIKQAFSARNWKQLALLLLERDNTDRLCGAEINSIASIYSKNVLETNPELILLVSDTPAGKDIGDLLKLYYESSKNPIQFKQPISPPRVLRGLRDDDIAAFKQQGLKNLVREISTEARNFSPETIAINATGGYKAQISFAGMIGQALEIPVYYLFEEFSEVIELPPQSVSLDLAFWLNNYPLFEQLESDQIVKKSELKSLISDEPLQALTEEVDIDGVAYITLSAMGILFHERARLQFAKQEKTLLSLIPQVETAPEKKQINLRDDHGKDVLQEFSKKICRSPYVVKIINSLPYNPKQVDPILNAKEDGIVEFVLSWTDRGLGLCIQTTGRNKAETNTIALHLKRQFSK